MDLTKGNIVKVFWFRTRKLELSQDKKEELRNQGMQKQVEVILNKMINGQADVNDLRNSVVDGRNTVKKMENMELTQMEEIWVQIGHPETKQILNQIESTSDFQNWADPFIINKIKNII